MTKEESQEVAAHSKAVGLALESADKLDAKGDFESKEVAASLRYLATMLADCQEALAEEREYASGLAQDCEEMVQRLARLDHHLRHGIVHEVTRKLADYAGGFADYDLGIAYDERDNPPPDPFPDAQPPAKPRRKRRAKA